MIITPQAWQDVIGHYDSLTRVSPKRYVLLVETCGKLFQNIAVANYFAPLFSHGTLFLLPTDSVCGTQLMLSANSDASMTLMYINSTNNEKRETRSFVNIGGGRSDCPYRKYVTPRFKEPITVKKSTGATTEVTIRQIIDAVKDFAKEKIPILIGKQIATFVNPAGGFGAALTVLGWFANNIDNLTAAAKDVKKFVSTLAVNADAIGKGNTEVVATAVEKAIKDVAPLALDIVFHLMGFASLPNNIVGFVRKQQTRIDGLVDKVLDPLTKKAKDLFDKIVGAIKGSTTGW